MQQRLENNGPFDAHAFALLLAQARSGRQYVHAESQELVMNLAQQMWQGNSYPLNTEVSLVESGLQPHGALYLFTGVWNQV